MANEKISFDERCRQLAEHLVTPERYGRAAVLQAVETPPGAFPHGLRLCDPPEHGFERDPNFTPPEAA